MVFTDSRLKKASGVLSTRIGNTRVVSRSWTDQHGQANLHPDDLVHVEPLIVYSSFAKNSDVDLNMLFFFRKVHTLVYLIKKITICKAI